MEADGGDGDDDDDTGWRRRRIPTTTRGMLIVVVVSQVCVSFLSLTVNRVCVVNVVVAVAAVVVMHRSDRINSAAPRYSTLSPSAKARQSWVSRWAGTATRLGRERPSSSTITIRPWPAGEIRGIWRVMYLYTPSPHLLDGRGKHNRNLIPPLSDQHHGAGSDAGERRPDWQSSDRRGGLRRVANDKS